MHFPGDFRDRARSAIFSRQGRLLGGATSENTRRSYEIGWRQFTAHANALGLEPWARTRRSSRPSWAIYATAGPQPRHWVRARR